MPYKMVYVPDELDQTMAADGWLSADLAMRFYGYTLGNLLGMARSTSVGHQRTRGRDWFNHEDLEDLKAGRFPSDRHRAEREHWELFGTPPETVQTRSASAAPSLQQYLEEFGR